jgi:ribosomal protein S18 acetylase RimI-like enzyme
LLLLFGGLDPPALFGLGDASGVAAILDRAHLPPKVYLTTRPEHWPVVRRKYRLQFEVSMLRMVLDAQAFRESGRRTVRKLGTDDLGEVEALYALGKGTDADGFAPFQVGRGVFYGCDADAKLVSVAGTHVVSVRYGLGAVGNVFTHPEYRGQGYALACTSAVTAHLLEQELEVVLNVSARNKAAVSLYRRLGYETYCRFFEGVGVSKRSTRESP